MNDIYRKATCPWGDKAIKLLDEKNIVYQDHIFANKAEEEAFKKKHHVQTTPQIFLDGERVGGFTDLQAHFGAEEPSDAIEALLKTYQAIIAVFCVALLLTFARGFNLMYFMGHFLALLACLKLMNIESFVQGFLKYDLLAQKEKRYAYVYAFLELAVALMFLSRTALDLAAVLAMVMGGIGGVSVFKAVFVEHQDLNCACIGGETQLPLGVVSFSENIAMLLMGMMILF